MSYRPKIKPVPSSDRKTRGSVVQNESFRGDNDIVYKQSLTYEVWDAYTDKWNLCETVLDDRGCWYKQENAQYLLYLRTKNTGSEDVIDWIPTNLVKPIFRKQLLQRNRTSVMDLPKPQANKAPPSQIKPETSNDNSSVAMKKVSRSKLAKKSTVSQRQRKEAEKLFYESDSQQTFFGFKTQANYSKKKNQSLAKSSLMMTRNESVPKSSNKSTKGNKINHLKESSKNKAKGNVSKPTVAKDKHAFNVQTKSGRTLRKPVRFVDEDKGAEVTYVKSPTTEQVPNQLKKPSPKTNQSVNKSLINKTSNKNVTKKDESVEMKKSIAEMQARITKISKRMEDASFVKKIEELIESRVKAAVEPLQAAIRKQQKTIDEQRHTIDKLVEGEKQSARMFMKNAKRKNSNIPSNVTFLSAKKNKSNKVEFQKKVEKRKSYDEESAANLSKIRKIESTKNMLPENKKPKKYKKRTDIRRKLPPNGHVKSAELTKEQGSPLVAQKFKNAERAAQSKSGRKITPNTKYGENDYLCPDDINDDN